MHIIPGYGDTELCGGAIVEGGERGGTVRKWSVARK